MAPPGRALHSEPMLFKHVRLPDGVDLTVAQLKMFVALYYGYFYTNKEPKLQGNWKDKAHYDAYEKNAMDVLRSVLAEPVHRLEPSEVCVSEERNVAQQEQRAQHDMVEDEFREYADAGFAIFSMYVGDEEGLDAIQVHPPPAAGQAATAQRSTSGSSQHGEIPLDIGHVRLSQFQLSPEGRLVVLVRSRVNLVEQALFALERAKLAEKPKTERIFRNSGDARPHLAKCFYARALALFMEADGYATVKGLRDGHTGSHSVLNVPLGKQLRNYYSGEFVWRQQDQHHAQGPLSEPVTLTKVDAETMTTLVTRHVAAELCLRDAVGLLIEQQEVDNAAPGITAESDLKLCCLQLQRMARFAGQREICLPEPFHFCTGAAAGLAFRHACDQRDQPWQALLMSTLAIGTGTVIVRWLMGIQRLQHEHNVDNNQRLNNRDYGVLNLIWGCRLSVFLCDPVSGKPRQPNTAICLAVLVLALWLACGFLLMMGGLMDARPFFSMALFCVVTALLAAGYTGTSFCTLLNYLMGSTHQWAGRPLHLEQIFDPSGAIAWASQLLGLGASTTCAVLIEICYQPEDPATVDPPTTLYHAIGSFAEFLSRTLQLLW